MKNHFLKVVAFLADTCPLENWVLTVFIVIQELYSACNHIVTKPKPKVEPPKEETPSEQNGPVNGEEGPETRTGKPEKGQAAPENTDAKLPNMDLDWVSSASSASAPASLAPLICLEKTFDFGEAGCPVRWRVSFFLFKNRIHRDPISLFKFFKQEKHVI